MADTPKKGFWANLFSPTPAQSCVCPTIEEIKDDEVSVVTPEAAASAPVAAASCTAAQAAACTATEQTPAAVTPTQTKPSTT